MSSTVWVPVLASMKGFIAEVNKGADQASKSAGSALEKGLGDAGKRGGQSAASELAKTVEAQTKKVVAARQRQAGAAAELATAETQLDNLRKRGDASASQIAAAEARVETARSKSESMSARVQAAEKDLDAVRSGGEARANSQVSAENRLADAKLKAEEATRRVSVAETKAAEEKAKSVEAADRVQAAELKLFDTRDRYGANTKETAAAEKELDRARREADSAAVKAVKAEGDVAVKRTAAKSATDTLKAAELSHKATLDDVERATREAAAATDDMGDAMSGAEGKTGGLATGLGSLVKNALGIGAAIMGVQGIGSAVSSGFDRFTTIEDATASMTVIMGDAAKAADLAAGIQESVSGTPFNLDQFMDAGKNLAAFGIEADKIPGIMRSVGEAAAASGKGAEGVGRITDALGKMSAKGKVSLDEVWTISESGVDALTILANGFGVSTDEMQKMISNGAVPAAEAIDLLSKGIMEGSDGIAGSTNSLEGTMESLRGTLSGTLGGMRSSMARAGASLVEASLPLIQLAATGITWLANSLSKMVKWLRDNEPAAQALGLALAAVVSGLVAFNTVSSVQSAGGLAAAFLKLADGAKKSAVGTALLNSAMWTSPITWVVAGIVAVVGALALFFTKTEIGRELWSRFTDGLASGWEWATGKITAGIDLVKGAWQDIKDAFTVDDRAVEGDGPLGQLIGVSNAGLILGTIQTVKGAWEDIKSAFSGDGVDTGALAYLIGEEKADWVLNIIANVKDAWSELTTAFSGGDTGSGALEAIFGEQGAETIVSTVTVIGDGLRMLGDWLLKAGEAGMSAGASLGGAVWETAKALFSALVTVGRALFDSFVAIAGAVWQVIQAVAPVLLPILKVVGAVIGGVLLVGIVAVVAAFRLAAEVIKIAAGVISWLATTVLAPLIGVVANVIAAIISMPGAVIDTVTSVLAWFSDMKDRTTEWFSDMGAAITAWWEEHVATLPGKVSGAVASVKQWFLDLMTSVRNWFSDMGRAVSDFWTTKVQPLPGQVASAVQGVLTNLGRLPGQVRSLFADAGSWLVNSGRSIINGLWEGMRAAWSSVKNWLSDNLSFSAVGSLVGLRAGGIVQMADGGVTRAYIDGGIDQLEAYANGGSRENHRAQIAPAGAWRVWAEPETGGEAYIPLASSKRSRSEAILHEVADRFGYMLVESDTGRPYAGGYSGDLGPQHVTAFADGAVVSNDELRSFALGAGASRPLEGAPYVFGGSNWGDCSGTVSAFAAKAVGISPFPRKFYTGDQAAWLSRHGFSRGRGGPGDLRIGFKNGGPAGGHTAGTLPDGTNFEMGGARGNGQFGGGAAGAWDSYFNEFFYLPVGPGFEKVTLDDWAPLGADPVTNPAYPTGQSDYGTVSNVSASRASTTQAVIDPTKAAPSSPAEAAAYGTAVARSVFADEMGGKSLLQIGAEGIFDFLGMGDSLTKKLLLTPLDELAPLPDWYGKPSSAVDGARTAVAEDHATAIHGQAVTTMTASAIADDRQLKSSMADIDLGVAGLEFSSAWDGRDHGLAEHSYMIGEEAARGLLDTVTDVGTSSGLTSRESPVVAAYRALIGTGDYRDDLRAVGVGDDHPLVDAVLTARSAGLYDTGGILHHGGLALNLSRKPEAILTNDQWQKIGDLGQSLTGPTGTGGDTEAVVTLVVNIDGDEALVQRVDTIDGRVEVNEKELRKLTTQRASADLAVNMIA